MARKPTPAEMKSLCDDWEILDLIEGPFPAPSDLCKHPYADTPFSVDGVREMPLLVACARLRCCWGFRVLLVRCFASVEQRAGFPLAVMRPSGWASYSRKAGLADSASIEELAALLNIYTENSKLLTQRLAAECDRCGIDPAAMIRAIVAWPLTLRAAQSAADLLARLEAAAGALPRASIDYPGGDGSAAAALPGPARLEVRLWEGAEYSERNIRLARTRSAYLEAHGDVTAALAALKTGGNTVGRSTFYDHLGALDNVCPGWRSHMMLSGASGIPENGVSVRPRGKSRARVR